MSPRVCQGLQSCLEPWPVQLRVFTHKLGPLNSNFSHSIPCHAMPTQHQLDTNSSNKNGAEDCDSKSISDMGGWSFLQALGNPSHTHSGKEEAADEKEEVYVHPLVKRSSSTLSTKSLEMCTESLGSETGSDTGEGSYEFSSAPAQTQRYRSRELSKKMIRDGSIPPPLSSTGGVVLRPYREGGRLVIEAVPVPHRKACFQAERVDGRLRLSLLKGSALDVEVAKDKVIIDQVKAVDGEDEDGDDSHGGYWGDDIGGSSGNGGCEIEIEELPRPSRCKEDGSTRNKVMSNWGPSWVTIS